MQDTVVSAAILLVSILSTLPSLFGVWEGIYADNATGRSPQHTYSYRHDDYPHAWPLPQLRLVYLTHEDSAHYALDTDLGIREWNATLPSGGSLLYLGPDHSPFTLSMFHQLRCLNIIRDVIVDLFEGALSPDTILAHMALENSRQPLVHHCMDYLRQTVMCRSDLRLENVRADTGPQITVSDITHTCKDWTAVYEAAEENHENFIVTRRDLVH